MMTKQQYVKILKACLNWVDKQLEKENDQALQKNLVLFYLFIDGLVQLAKTGVFSEYLMDMDKNEISYDLNRIMVLAKSKGVDFSERDFMLMYRQITDQAHRELSELKKKENELSHLSFFWRFGSNRLGAENVAEYSNLDLTDGSAKNFSLHQ